MIHHHHAVAVTIPSGKLISLYDTSATEQPDHALFSVGLQSETGDKCNINPSFCVPLRGAVPPV
ncbi:hypothetical protein, partial [Chimaeribacter arupi]|uniref:hypothetical protein n=1 Tax=Chimaeribacter arupi TaxID=2060066 RepID=UPI0019D4E9A4